MLIFFFALLALCINLESVIENRRWGTIDSFGIHKPRPLIKDSHEIKMLVEYYYEKVKFDNEPSLNEDVSLLKDFLALVPILTAELYSYDYDNFTLKMNEDGNLYIDVLENHIVTHPCLYGEKPSDRKMDMVTEHRGKVVYKRYIFACSLKNETDCPSWDFENTMSDIPVISNLLVMGSDQKVVAVGQWRNIYDCILHRKDEPSYVTKTERLAFLNHSWDSYLNLDEEERMYIFTISQEIYKVSKWAQRNIPLMIRQEIEKSKNDSFNISNDSLILRF